MTSTDELRKLLDERGVKYFHNDYGLHKETRWTFGSAGIAIYTEYEKSGNKNFSMVTENDYSPEQAIAATLGNGTCELIDRGKFMPSHEFHRVECSECGVLFWQSHGHLPAARFCPSCGAEVVKR